MKTKNFLSVKYVQLNKNFGFYFDSASLCVVNCQMCKCVSLHFLLGAVHILCQLIWGLVTIKCLGIGLYSLEDCHNPFGKRVSIEKNRNILLGWSARWLDEWKSEHFFLPQRFCRGNLFWKDLLGRWKLMPFTTHNQSPHSKRQNFIRTHPRLQSWIIPNVFQRLAHNY